MGHTVLPAGAERDDRTPLLFDAQDPVVHDRRRRIADPAIFITYPGRQEHGGLHL